MKKVFTLAVLIALGLSFAPQAEAQAAPSVTIKWVAPLGNYSGIDIYRGSGACPASGSPVTNAKVGTVAAPAVQFTDTNVIRGNTYCYFARSFDTASSLQSGDSNTAPAVVPFLPPNPPTGITVVVN